MKNRGTWRAKNGHQMEIPWGTAVRKFKGKKAASREDGLPGYRRWWFSCWFDAIFANPKPIVARVAARTRGD